MQKKTFGLITKTSFIYLAFILIAFFATAGFIIDKTNRYIEEDTEEYFSRKEGRLQRNLHRKNYDSSRIRGLELINPHDTVNKTYPLYQDTLLYINQIDESLLFHTKRILVDTEQGLMEYTMRKNINDIDALRNSLVRAIIHAFILLAITIGVFSFFLSGFLFRPFRKILGGMARYKPGGYFRTPNVSTSTSEFKKMQELFEKMIQRTESDFFNLKEYTENMAHEIQTPLSIIRSKTERLIANEHVMKYHAPVIKSIYEETNHLSKLGNTLNLLTKIENEEYANVQNINTKEPILQHLEAVKEIIDLKGFTIKTQLDEQHYLKIDPILFDIMLKNLIRNALRYGSTKGPITIHTINNKLVISNYSDSPALDPGKIFDRFTGSNGTKSAMGLGLALVKRICELNNLSVNYTHSDNEHTFTIHPAKA